MPNHFTHLSVSAQTAFANLNEAVLNADIGRTVADLPGNFTSKTIKGRCYWYYQAQTPDGRPMQIYVGPDSERVQRLIAQKASASHGAPTHIEQLSRACQAMGCTAPLLPHGRVIKKLADFGFFRAGGILAGTHAFLAYQNHLGLTWQSGQATTDIDFMHAGKGLSIALPATVRIDTHKAIESLQMGFFPVADHAKYIKLDEQDFALDFLTVMGKSGGKPIFSKQLNVQLQPLKFMELSIEDPLQTTLLTRQGAVLINLPQPDRFAVHKLIVQGERKNQPIKSAKDVIQASALVEWFLLNNPDALMDRIAQTQKTGPGWRRRLNQGLLALQGRFPDLFERLQGMGLTLEGKGRKAPHRN